MKKPATSVWCLLENLGVFQISFGGVPLLPSGYLPRLSCSILDFIGDSYDKDTCMGAFETVFEDAFSLSSDCVHIGPLEFYSHYQSISDHRDEANFLVAHLTQEGEENSDFVVDFDRVEFCSKTIKEKLAIEGELEQTTAEKKKKRRGATQMLRRHLAAAEDVGDYRRAEVQRSLLDTYDSDASDMDADNDADDNDAGTSDNS